MWPERRLADHGEDAQVQVGPPPVPGLTPADEDDDPEHADTITFE